MFEWVKELALIVLCFKMFLRMSVPMPVANLMAFKSATGCVFYPPLQENRLGPPEFFWNDRTAVIDIY